MLTSLTGAKAEVPILKTPALYHMLCALSVAVFATYVSVILAASIAPFIGNSRVV